MPVLSLGRNAIFSQDAKVALQIDGFPNFYAVLGMPREASSSQLETAITSRAADLLTASFSRGGQGELLVLLRRHIADFRPVLLDKTVRLAYDEQLRHHETGDARSLPFATWKQTLVGGNRLARGFQNASRGFKARLKAAFWDAEYI